MKPYEKGLLIYSVALLFFAMTFAMPVLGNDWGIFKQAALVMFEGGNPYSVHGFYNAPWLLIPLYPLAILPNVLGHAILNGLSAGVLAWLSLRLKRGPWGLAAILLCYPVLVGMYYGQVDWLILIGMVIHPVGGMFLFFAKPQIGLGMIAYYAYNRQWKVFVPVAVATLLSFVLYGLWFLKGGEVVGSEWNASWGITAIPIGILLLKANEKETALAASPFLAPYFGPHSWMVSLVYIPDRYLVWISLLTWVLRALTSFSLR